MREFLFLLWQVGRLLLWAFLGVVKLAIYAWMGLFMLITGGLALVTAFFLTVCVMVITSGVFFILHH